MSLHLPELCAMQCSQTGSALTAWMAHIANVADVPRVGVGGLADDIMCHISIQNPSNSSPGGGGGWEAGSS